MARLTITIPTPRGGLLSLLGLAWLVCLLTLAVWQLTAPGWGLLTLALTGGPALLTADTIIYGDGRRTGGRP